MGKIVKVKFGRAPGVEFFVTLHGETDTVRLYSIKSAAGLLKDLGYTYVVGSNGVWSLP